METATVWGRGQISYCRHQPQDLALAMSSLNLSLGDCFQQALLTQGTLQTPNKDLDVTTGTVGLQG